MCRQQSGYGFPSGFHSQSGFASVRINRGRIAKIFCEIRHHGIKHFFVHRCCSGIIKIYPLHSWKKSGCKFRTINSLNRIKSYNFSRVFKKIGNSHFGLDYFLPAPGNPMAVFNASREIFMT